MKLLAIAAILASLTVCALGSSLKSEINSMEAKVSAAMKAKDFKAMFHYIKSGVHVPLAGRVSTHSPALRKSCASVR